MKCLFGHKWSRWGSVRVDDGKRYFQTRWCTRCSKADVREVKL